MLQSLRLWLLSLALAVQRAGGRTFRPDSVNGWILYGHPNAIYDPPYCATKVACILQDIVDAAQQVIAMTGDCVGELESPPDCANDIFGFLTDMVDIAACSAGLSMACAGELTGCEIAAFGTCEDGMGIAMDMIGASTNCDVDAFLCTINVADAARDLIGWALDIRAAVKICPKQREKFWHKWLKHEHPDWFKYRLLDHSASGANATKKDTFIPEPHLSGLYKATVGAEYLRPYQRADTRIGLVDVTHSGPILAIDAPGILRIGSAYVVPSSNILFGKSDRLHIEDNRRLSEQGPSQLMTLHDTDVEVFYIGDMETMEDGPEGIQAYE